jgi:arylsulfatase A-like enzyme/Tfp pilus assembly protein PilF
VAALLFVAAAVLGLGLLVGAQPPRPSLVLITLDTVRADHLGSYGDKAAATPVLDRLAREGLRFADATTHAPITGPAHAGILTGLYPARFGIRDNAATPLPPDAMTLAEVLKGAGYRTGGFIGAFILDRAYGFDQGFELFDSEFAGFDPRARLNAERPAAAVVERTIAWLKTLSPGQPFFAWVHLYDAHSPYTPPAPFDKAFRARPYDGEIAGVDRAIGSVIAALEERGLLDRTLVVAIGDHGEGLGEHGEDAHGVFLYDSVLRVPWLMRLPGKERAGTVVREQVRAVDLMPTVLDALQVTSPKGLDGESLLGVIRGRPRQDVPPAYAETYYPKLHYGWSELRAVRVGDWKFIEAPRPELYALRTDPFERSDVVVRQGGLASRLGAELAGIASAWSRVPERAAPAPDRETLERLRSLGYVGFGTPAVSGAGGADPKDMISTLSTFNQLMGDATEDLRAGRRTAAADKLTRALAINKRAYNVHVMLGDVYLESKKYEQALGEYEAAALLNPNSAAPLLGAASTLLSQGKLDLAAGKVDEAERLEPLSSEVPFARGRLSERAGRNPEALGHYQRAVTANPSDPRPRARLANAAIQLRLVDVAAAQFTELLAMGYEPARTHFGLGWVAQARGDRATAAREYRQALALDPGLTVAREALARLEAKR